MRGASLFLIVLIVLAPTSMPQFGHKTDSFMNNRSVESATLADLIISRLGSAYEVRLAASGGRLVFVEPDAWQGNSDVFPVAGGARVGHHWSQFLMLSPGKWLTDRVESEGQRLVSFKVLQESGKVVSYFGTWKFRDYFTVSALHYFWVNGDILYRYVTANLTVTGDIPDPVGAIWVELMNDPNYYGVAVTKTTEGIVTKDMHGATGHALKEYTLDDYGWIMLYEPLASNVQGSPALVKVKATHAVHPTVCDCSNVDNIELHLMGKDETRNLAKGEFFELSYLLIVSTETQSYDWIDPAVDRAKHVIDDIRSGSYTFTSVQTTLRQTETRTESPPASMSEPLRSSFSSNSMQWIAYGAIFLAAMAALLYAIRPRQKRREKPSKKPRVKEIRSTIGKHRVKEIQTRTKSSALKVEEE